MNERILDLALKSGLINYIDNETPRRYFISGHAELEEIQEFAELVMAIEREACAKLIESRKIGSMLDSVRDAEAAAIRARGREMTDLERKAMKRVFELLEIAQGDLRDATEILRQALAQPEQEPVAWMCSDELVRKGYIRISNSRDETWNIPLYTEPPKREWVGLTDEELPQGATYEFDRGVRWAETQLKEKNL